MSRSSSNQTTMSSSGSNQTQSSFGISIELFNANCSATVFLLDYDREVKFLRNGGFVVNLILQSSSPVMMITCVVDHLEWPISKDAPVIRVGQRCFAFGMPSLLYGLQFPPSCEEEKISTLERVFIKFAQYKDLDMRKLPYYVFPDSGYPWKDDDPKLWDKLFSRIETIAHSALSQFGHHPGKSPFAVGDQDSSVVRILRTSAITKMVGDAILSGSLKPNHIEIQDMRPNQEYSGDSGSSAIIIEQAFASISVFTNLVEAVELFWVIGSGISHLLKQKNANFKELVAFKMWSLNQVGLAAFLKKLPVEE